jgi:hypothetical protein
VKYFASIACEGVTAVLTVPDITKPVGEIRGTSREEIVMRAVALSTPSVAVTVSTVVATAPVGVPEITPVKVLKARPAGRAGEIE